jgi:MoxR-like ATPase
MDVAAAGDTCRDIVTALSDAIVADERFFEDLLVGYLGRGHVLIEDVPGTGKTLTARSLATILGLSFSRVQLTPDLLPADITGTQVFDERDSSFEFRKGPVFANVVLADELNRAPPKSQAALLEAMEEGQVTSEGETHPLPDPFLVLATQNPVDQEGTFELPAAQQDRFLVKTAVGYPDADGERALLRRRMDRSETTPSVESLLADGTARELRTVPEAVAVDDALLDYVAAIARATREDRRVATGVSPRGTQRFLEAARAFAVIEGRDYLVPDDVVRVSEPVLAHRLVLTPEAAVRETDPATIIDSAVDGVPVPNVPT